MLMQDGLIMVLCLLLGILLDAGLGEVKKFHPLVGFGNLVNAIERGLNKPTATRWTGALAWCLAVLPLVALSLVVLLLAQRFSLWLAPILHIILLYFCLGLRSLHEHNAAIATALQTGDLAEARKRDRKSVV